MFSFVLVQGSIITEKQISYQLHWKKLFRIFHDVNTPFTDDIYIPINLDHEKTNRDYHFSTYF